MSRRSLAAAAVAAVMLAVPAVAQSSCDTSPAAVKEAAAIAQQGYAQWIAAEKVNNADAAGALYTDDAVLLPPGEPARVGRSAILEWYHASNRGPAALADETFTPTALARCGDMILDVSEFRGHFNVPGKGIFPFHGKNMVIWKKDADGKWKLYRDMWSNIKETPAT